MWPYSCLRFKPLRLQTKGMDGYLGARVIMFKPRTILEDARHRARLYLELFNSNFYGYLTHKDAQEAFSNYDYREGQLYDELTNSGHTLKVAPQEIILDLQYLKFCAKAQTDLTNIELYERCRAMMAKQLNKEFPYAWFSCNIKRGPSLGFDPLSENTLSLEDGLSWIAQRTLDVYIHTLTGKISEDFSGVPAAMIKDARDSLVDMLQACHGIRLSDKKGDVIGIVPLTEAEISEQQQRTIIERLQAENCITEVELKSLKL